MKKCGELQWTIEVRENGMVLPVERPSMHLESRTGDYGKVSLESKISTPSPTKVVGAAWYDLGE